MPAPYYYTAQRIGRNPQYLRVNLPKEFVEAIAAHLGVTAEELCQGYKLEANYFGSASIVYRFVPKGQDPTQASQPLDLRIAPGVPPPTGLPQTPAATPSVLPPELGRPVLDVLEWWPEALTSPNPKAP